MAVTAAAAITAGMPAAASVAPAKRPNIVLIVSDDHGLDALGCYGNPVIRTPNLDELARNGTRFTNAFCTSASCSPSRSVILTGQQNHRNGMYGLQHDTHHFECFGAVCGLPAMLAAAGYRTARVGKFHVAPEKVFAFQTVLSRGAANDPATIGRSPVEMAELARATIESHDPRPFFLYYATDDPHRANTILPDGQTTFDTYPKPNSFGNRESGYPGITPQIYRKEDVLVPSHLPDTVECRAELAEYYQSVSRMDQGIGRLIDILKRAGGYDNTLIIYISDNGMAFPGAKTTLYEPGMKLPCIARAPGHSRPGFVQPALVSWADITPTILDAAGALPPEADTQFDGVSFLSAIKDDVTVGNRRNEVYASHSLHEITMYYPMRVVRTERYKLIYNLANTLDFPFALDLIQSPTWISIIRSGEKYYGKRSIEAFIRRPRFELYDLENDPDEIRNLIDDPVHVQTKNELIVRLKAFQTRSRDPWLHKWNYE